MRNMAMSALLVLASSPLARGAEPPGYYLTGVYGDPARGLVALVQLADGRNGRLRVGETFPHGTVRAIGPQWIEVEPSGGGELVRVWLRGMAPPAPPRAPEGAPASPPGGAPETRPGPDPAPVAADAGPAAAGQAPAAAPRSAAAGPDEPRAVPGAGVPLAAGARPAPGTAPARPATDAGGAPAADLAADGQGGTALPDSRTLADLAQTLGRLQMPNEPALTAADLGEVLGPLLGFPAGARVVELQSRPPASFRDGLESVRRAAARNETVRLTIEQDGQRQRLMVMPTADGSGRVILAPVDGSGR